MQIDSVTLSKNVDRIIKYNENYIAASYHLDKETNTKTGSLTEVKINQNKYTITCFIL